MIQTDTGNLYHNSGSGEAKTARELIPRVQKNSPGKSRQ